MQVESTYWKQYFLALHWETNSETFNTAIVKAAVLKCLALFYELKEYDYMWVFLGAAMMVVLAEMGDKTQLLAMALATRFSARSVIWGVLIATVLNHGLAVLLGTYLGASLRLEWVQWIAAASFIFFGLWTIRGDTLNNEHQRKLVVGPIITVAIAFFLAEMGDKTQLATIALAAKYESPFLTLLGTTVGMLVADGLGIYVGVVAGRKIPERTVKWVSAIIFIVFGLVELYLASPKAYLTPLNIFIVLALTIISVWWIGRKS